MVTSVFVNLVHLDLCTKKMIDVGAVNPQNHILLEEKTDRAVTNIFTDIKVLRLSIAVDRRGKLTVYAVNVRVMVHIPLTETLGIICLQGHFNQS